MSSCLVYLRGGPRKKRVLALSTHRFRLSVLLVLNIVNSFKSDKSNNSYASSFGKIYNFFPQNATFSRKLIECSFEIAGPMDRTPNRTYPIFETFLFLITTRRFGDVGALEGREIVPDIFIQHFPAKSGFLASHYGWAGPAENTTFFRKMRFFAQNASFPAKSNIGGVRTWDIRRM